jgi:hypothetical protein
MGTEHRSSSSDHRDGKPGLRTWWQHITTTQKPRPMPPPHPTHAYGGGHHVQSQKGGGAGAGGAGLAQEYVPPPPGAVFGSPLKDSLRYANVQVSTADLSGKLYVWGYIPVVVAKWCVPSPSSSSSSSFSFSPFLSPPLPLSVPPFFYTLYFCLREMC